MSALQITLSLCISKWSDLVQVFPIQMFYRLSDVPPYTMCVSANVCTCLLKVNFESFSATNPNYIYVCDINRTHLAVFQK